MEKPFKLDMPFGEALRRLARVPKKKSDPQRIDYAKQYGKNTGATKKSRRAGQK
jgi:hypothetical protein